MCISPVYKLVNGERQFVPCGRCYQCVRRKKSDWIVRMTAAMNWADCSFFKLLTYDDEHYPADISREAQTLVIQQFVRLLRLTLKRKFGEDIVLKYFIASELGELHNRLHYHCSFFVKGAKFTWAEFNEICRSRWPYGIVGNAYRLTSSNIRYCVKYIQKQYNYKWYSQFSLKDMIPDWKTRFKDYNLVDYDHLPCYIVAGKKLPLPRWWLKLIFEKGVPYPVVNQQITGLTSNKRAVYVIAAFALVRALYEERQRDLPVDNWERERFQQYCFENKEGKDIKPYIPPPRQSNNDLIAFKT